MLISFDEFKEIIFECDLQDYLGRYQDLRDEWRRKRENGESTDISDDIIFEIELIKQIEINNDYILIIIGKLKVFFEKYFGIGNRTFESKPEV